MTGKPSYFQITMDYDVWCEFLDPSARVTKEDFNLMTLVERMAYISGCYGDERVDELGDITF